MSVKLDCAAAGCDTHIGGEDHYGYGGGGHYGYCQRHWGALPGWLQTAIWTIHYQSVPTDSLEWTVIGLRAVLELARREEKRELAAVFERQIADMLRAYAPEGTSDDVIVATLDRGMQPWPGKIVLGVRDQFRFKREALGVEAASLPPKMIEAITEEAEEVRLRFLKVRPLEPGSEILEVSVQQLASGKWFAGVRHRVPGQGGYGQMPYDDAWRSDFASEANARDWVVAKTAGCYLKLEETKRESS